MRYQVERSVRNKSGPKVVVSEPLKTEGHALALAEQWDREFPCKTITILRDSEGADHPDNAGKFFLDRIYK